MMNQLSNNVMTDEVIAIHRVEDLSNDYVFQYTVFFKWNHVHFLALYPPPELIE